MADEMSLDEALTLAEGKRVEQIIWTNSPNLVPTANWQPGLVFRLRVTVWRDEVNHVDGLAMLVEVLDSLPLAEYQARYGGADHRGLNP